MVLQCYTQNETPPTKKIYIKKHCHVRIEKGPVQTVAVKLEAHNSLECHYMLKHYDLYSWKLLK